MQIDGGNNAEVKTLLGEIAMHVTAGMPVPATAVNRAGVDKAVVEKEKATAAEGITGKPPAIVEKIVTGKLDKFFAEVVLLEQPFVKEEKLKVRELVAQTAKATGATLEVVRFCRLKVGEV